MDLHIGDRVTIAIEAVAFGGEGLGRVGRIVLFVPFTVEGDVVEAQVTEVRKRFARGRLARLVTPSQHRVEPRCLYYGLCGGCSYQHIGYDHQLYLKKQQVKDACERIGKLPAPPVSDAVPSPLVYGYRGKADFHVEMAPGRPPRIGFMDVGGGRLVDIKRCEIVDDSINERLELLRGKAADGTVPVSGGRFTIWSGALPDDADDPFVGRVAAVERIVGEHSFMVPSDGFFQANTALIARLVKEVTRISDLSDQEKVVDVYCGSGLFSIFLAPAAAEIFGIETNGDAIRCARVNAERAGINNIRFIQGDAGEILRRRFATSGKAVDILVLDPPRTGCDEKTLSAVAQIKPRTLIYVSCNPATQARDIRYLTDRGFTLKELMPIDMFPQTAHIEVIGTLLGKKRT
jgi:23S rRNA (uracil1939-C5)-methyltransferase